MNTKEIQTQASTIIAQAGFIDALDVHDIEVLTWLTRVIMLRHLKTELDIPQEWLVDGLPDKFIPPLKTRHTKTFCCLAKLAEYGYLSRNVVRAEHKLGEAKRTLTLHPDAIIRDISKSRTRRRVAHQAKSAHDQLKMGGGGL